MQADPAQLGPDDGLDDIAGDISEVDDGGTGAALALVLALLAFVAAVAFVILRHLLFRA